MDINPAVEESEQLKDDPAAVQLSELNTSKSKVNDSGGDHKAYYQAEKRSQKRYNKFAIYHIKY